MSTFLQFFIRFAFAAVLFFLPINKSISISYTPIHQHSIEPQQSQNTNTPPIEPKKTKSKSKIKPAFTKPVWDIVYMYAIVGGGALLPISLLLLGLGLGWGLSWLWLLGLGLVFLLILSFLLFHISLRRNESGADFFIERALIIGIVGVLGLTALTVFLTALAIPIGWLWVAALGAFCLAALGTTLLIIRLKKT